MTADDTTRDRMAQLDKGGASYALATVVRCEKATSAKPGAKAVVEQDGSIAGWIGGGCAQPAVRRAARLVLADGKARLIRVSPVGSPAGGAGIEDYDAHCHSGGTLDIFIEPVLPVPSLLVIGASPVGQVLADLAKRMGYAVTVACAEADGALFAGADRVVAGFDLGADAGDIARFVVVATQGRKDRAGLEAALATGAPYIALIASRRKAAALKKILRDNGHDGEKIAAIRAPAGLDIGAVTAEEIAASIVAEIVRERRRDMTRGLHEDASDGAGDGAGEGRALTWAAGMSCCGGGEDPN